MNVFLKRYEELGQRVERINLKTVIRTNLVKVTDKELVTTLRERGVKVQKLDFLDHGYYVKSKFAIASTPEHLQGWFYVQEAAAQLPVQVLKPSGLVLDCCAAPGGKTSQIAMLTSGVVALEKNYKRITVLKNNLERLGIKNVAVYNIDARKFETKFDQILVDAPCSGNFVTDKNWFKKQTVKNFEQRSKLQKQILGKMLNCLNDGGELVYSTCTLEPEENEFVIDWALNNFDVALTKIDCIGDKGVTYFKGKELNQDIKLCRRLWPNKTQTQGFFIAKFKK